jgi:simple sugar transport system ATP-binding protein
MFNGEIAAELDPQKTTVNEIGLYMSGAKRMDLATHEVIFDSTKGSSSSHA